MASEEGAAATRGWASWLLGLAFEDADELEDAGEAVLVLGPQLAEYTLLGMALASLGFLLAHVSRYSDRSMLLRALKKAIGWEREAAFMPYYAPADAPAPGDSPLSELARRAAGSSRYRDADAAARRAETLREVERMRAALLGLQDAEAVAAAARARAPPAAPPLEAAAPAADPPEGAPRGPARRRMSAREELLRRRGTSLASACRLLDESMHEFHGGGAADARRRGSSGAGAGGARSGTVQLFGRKLADGSSPPRSPGLADGSRMQRQQSYRHQKYS